MENERFQPYVRKRAAYRSWMRFPDPVPPSATRERMARRALINPENNLNRNIQEPQLDRNVPEPLADNNYGLQEMQLDQRVLPQEIQRQSSSDSISSLENEVSSEHLADASNYSDHEGEEENDDFENDEELEDAGPFKDPSLEEPLFPGGDCSKFECLLMILSFSLRHGLTQVATQDLCSMINHILRGDYIPTSKYMMRKIFGRSNYLINFYCKGCEAFITSKKSGEKMVGSIPCGVCGVECKLAKMNEGYFFVTLPVKDQLKFLLENTEDVTEQLDYRWSRNQPAPNIISDIYDGKVYAELARDGNFLSHRRNLSLTFNTDGAQVFEKAGKKSLWPIFFRINEFPPAVRFNFSNCLLAGMWFAHSEPNMHLFLSSFVQELDQLYEDGFFWKTPDGTRVNSKVILLNCIVDSKAKPLVQNCKTHNGYYGCGFCNHPGVMFEGSNQAKYPMNDDLSILVDNSFQFTVDASDPVTKEPKVFSVEDRKNDLIRRDMELAEANRNEVGEGEINGVRGKSVLINLPYFDLVFGFPVEYLHAVLLGCTRNVTLLWFDSTSHGKMYYVGKRINTVNRRLLNIKPPISISRRPRSLCERKSWHGNEWRSWLLYYSLPCMEGVLPKRYLRHHCLLVSAIFMLLKDGVSHDEIETATFYLGSYCREFQKLYSEDLMYFNVHLLLHLGKSVELWGPLFCYSAFSVEGANGKLVDLVNGTTGVLNQIAEKYSKCKMLPKVVSMYEVQETTHKFCQDLMSYQTAKVAHKCASVTVIGPLKSFALEEEEREAFVSSGCNETTASYERMIINNVMYHARCYMRKGEKSDSSTVQLISGQFGVIERILDPLNLKVPPVNEIHILLRDINIRPRDPIVAHSSGAKAEHIIRCTPVVYGDVRVISADEIKQLSILIDCFENSCITTFPNMYEKD